MLLWMPYSLIYILEDRLLILKMLVQKKIVVWSCVLGHLISISFLNFSGAGYGGFEIVTWHAKSRLIIGRCLVMCLFVWFVSVQVLLV